MTKLVSGMISGAALLFAVPALAQTPMGPRLEAHLGYDHVSQNGESANGFAYGLGIGYDFAANGPLGFGVDAEIADSNSDYDTVYRGVRAELSAGRDIYVGGRATYALAPTMNLYLKAGYTNARVKAQAGFGGGRWTLSENLDGLRIGAGWQIALTGNVYGLAEYRYSNYEDDFSRHQVLAGAGIRF